MFIHFLHDQLISLYSLDRRVPRRTLVEALRRALMSCAYLADGPLIMPTTDLVQSPVVGELIDELKLLAQAEALYLVGSTVNIDQLKSLKVAHFSDTGFHTQWATGAALSQLRRFEPNLRTRILNTTAEVRDRWIDDICRLSAEPVAALKPTLRQLRAVRDLLPGRPPSASFEQALIEVPQRLENHAFLWHVVEKLKLFPYTAPPPARNYLERVLAWNWARSYLPMPPTQ